MPRKDQNSGGTLLAIKKDEFCYFVIADSIGGLVAGLLASWAVRNLPPEEMSR